MKEKRPKRGQKYALYLILAGLAAVIVLTVACWFYYVRTIGQGRTQKQEQEYERHYVMIAEDSDSAVWQDIYRSAKKRAMEEQVYLELLGEWEDGEYTAADYVNIAVASKVDGIIVKPDGTARLRAAVDAADEAGIPVVTVLSDESQSRRRSFVGVNSYQMGTTYGEQILRCLKPETQKIMVLLDRVDAGKDLVFKQLKATVQAGIEPGRELQIDSMTVSRGTLFGAEEAIRDLFHQEETRPDLLVCMNETDSECAYYAMVDYNQVDKIQLIGYYPSEGMLGAVQKDIVPVVITLDTGQIGAYSIEALEEYYSMGYASSYFSVDLNIITKENVAQFLPGTDKAKD